MGTSEHINRFYFFWKCVLFFPLSWSVVKFWVVWTKISLLELGLFLHCISFISFHNFFILNLTWLVPVLGLKRQLQQEKIEDCFVHFDKWLIVHAPHMRCQQHHFFGGSLILWRLHWLVHHGGGRFDFLDPRQLSRM